MKLPVEYRGGIHEEISGAFRWYQEQRSGLGLEFLAALDDTFDVVRTRPEAFAVVHRDIRIAAVDRFPYGIYFRLRPDRIRVVGVLHFKRNPATWQRRR